MSDGFQHIDLSYLDQITEGDRLLQRDLLETLLRELQAEIPRMRALHSAGKWRELSEVSHRLKSSLAFAGNPAMSGAAEAIEAIAGEGTEFDQLSDHLAALEAEQPRVLAELRVVLAGMPGLADSSTATA